MLFLSPFLPLPVFPLSFPSFVSSSLPSSFFPPSLLTSFLPSSLLFSLSFLLYYLSSFSPFPSVLISSSPCPHPPILLPPSPSPSPSSLSCFLKCCNIQKPPCHTGLG